MEDKSNCQHCVSWEEEMYWKNFNCLQFFQILNKDFHDHLVLPEKFSAHMRTQLPEKVSLTGPSGIVWDVEVQKTDSLLLSGDGWKNFVKAYDLDENCLLMFKYKRNWGFEVLFLDRESLCEKEASYFVKKCSHTKSEHTEAKKHTKRTVREDSCTVALEDDNEDHSSELFLSKKHKKDVVEETNCLRREKYIEDPSNQTSNAPARGRARKGRPRRVVESNNPPEETPARNEATQEESPISLRYMTPPENEGSSPQKGHAEEQDNFEKTPSGNDTALKVNPISMRDLITPEDREVSSEMNHSDKLNSSGKEPSGTAENPSQVFGRELIVLDYRERSHEANHSQQPKRKRGRPKQATPKSSRKQVSRSHVSAQEYISNRRAVTETEKTDALQKATLEQTGNSFVVVMRPTCVYRRFYMSIPADWISKHLPLQHLKTVLRVGDKTWHTMFYYNQKRRVGGLCPGWKKFALDNSLEESDALLFKLIKQIKQNSDDAAIVFDVKIFRVVPEILRPLVVKSATF